MATLFSAVARIHGVDAQQLLELRGRRPFGVDLSVAGSFAILYLLVAVIVAGIIVGRFPVDEPAPAVVASLLVAAALSACGVVALGMWASAIEMVRISDAHLSYRADGLPWTHHNYEFFVAGVLMFLATAAFRYYRDYRRVIGNSATVAPNSAI
jgi:hypothetical protein